jgi:SRSO17 transposase
MDLATIIDGADRFVAYVEELTSVIGHADRALPLRDYCAGLLTAESRKSVEPMTAVTAPAQVSVQHQISCISLAKGSSNAEVSATDDSTLISAAFTPAAPITNVITAVAAVAILDLHEAPNMVFPPIGRSRI